VIDMEARGRGKPFDPSGCLRLISFSQFRLRPRKPQNRCLLCRDAPVSFMHGVCFQVKGHLISSGLDVAVYPASSLTCAGDFHNLWRLL
jgi:hypothetical protein